MDIRLANNITIDSIVDGPGLRTVIWTQGCLHNCKNCHNPSTHDLNGGFLKDINKLIDEINCVKFQSGVTISGGDPFFQPEQLYFLCKELKKYNYNIWCYTGFKFEYLIKKYKHILEYIDIIIDGEFIEELKNLDLKFKGSSNQRIIDIKETLKKNDIILYNME